MNEADRKRRLVSEVRLLGGQARRLEDRWAVGLLDLVIKLPGVPFIWAEGKLVSGNLFAPTGAQYEEGIKWIRAGTGVVLLGWQDSLMFISPWVKKADKRECWTSGKGSDADSLLEYLKVQNAKETESRDSA